MVTGAVALLLSKNPALTPDQVKDILTVSAREGLAEKKSVRGKGEISLDGAFARDARDITPTTDPTYGIGRLDWARAADALPCLSSASVDENRGEYKRIGSAKKWNGVCGDIANMGLGEQADALEVDIHGQRYDSRVHACDEAIDPEARDYYPASRACVGTAASHVRTRPWTSTAAGEMWNGTVWAGATFSGAPDLKLGRRTWNTAAWQDADWLGRMWKDHNWAGRMWTGRIWKGGAWEDSSWLGRMWTGRIWRDHDWTDSSWS
jgi:hypothetical protein